MTEEKVRKSYSCCRSGSSEFQGDLEKKENLLQKDKIKKTIREQYSTIATSKMSSNLPPNSEESIEPKNKGKYTDYSQNELESIPKGSNLGLGSGNPVELANIRPGELIVDLGSGAGIDCFLSAQKTGEKGHVIGIDMTPEMIEKSRFNAIEGGYNNVEFRLGEIEHIPVADNTADLIISNCVINLAVDKAQVFKEAYRILKPGGRLVISDIVLKEDFPSAVKEALKDTPGCVSRAWVTEEYLGVIKNAGFNEVEVLETQAIKPRNKREIKQSNGKQKRHLVMYNKKIEVELTPEEDKRLINSIMKAHIKAVKTTQLD
jgi:arsenite methyltransferase